MPFAYNALWMDSTKITALFAATADSVGKADSGLRLGTSWAIVEAKGGHPAFPSQLNRGTTFAPVPRSLAAKAGSTFRYVA